MKTCVLKLLAILMVAISCVNEDVSTSIADAEEFLCHIEKEESTRTSLDQNNNVIWSAEDQLIIFKKNSIPSKYQISENYIGKTYGSFYKINSDEFNAGSELDHNVALYPYQEDIEITKLDSDSPTSSYKITGYYFPAEQTYAENTFAIGAFPMAAVSDNYDLTFRNICGGIKLQLKGTQKITSVKIEGKNSEKLAGNADVVVYADENLKPAITMASNALTSVTLNCGEGVQLNERTVTEFIISLPPLLFNRGFTITLTDNTLQTYTVETDKANTVLRSSLLKMPTINLCDLGNSEGDEEGVIPVLALNITQSLLHLYPGSTYSLEVNVLPEEATDKSVTWSSSDPLIATVDQNGVVTAIADGQVEISANSGGLSDNCSIDVITAVLAEATRDYIDEYNINHGKGIVIGSRVWAPVNCGYHMTEYPYGKLYQYGRKYGQGLGGEFDLHEPQLIEGTANDLESSHNDALADYFWYGYAPWLNKNAYPEFNLWNGQESEPAKTKYDPCPSGWRIPTWRELYNLSNDHSEFTSDSDNLKGMYFRGTGYVKYDVTLPDEYITSNELFLPAIGYREGSSGEHINFGEMGNYWSSEVDRGYSSSSNPVSFYRYFHGDYDYIRSSETTHSSGLSVRCVQE